MVLAPLAVLVDAAVILFYLVGWIVALGLLYTWNATFHHLFQGIAQALTFKISVGIGPSKTIRLGGWANTIDHTAQELLSDWALGCEIIVGKFWHALTWIATEWSHAISRGSQATLDLGHWIVHSAVPSAINSAIEPWRTKSNKAAAAAGAAGALAGLLKKVTRAEHRAEQAANQATRAAARAAGHEAHAAKSVATTVERTVVHDTKVITQVVDVGALPIPFGRTVRQIRRRLGKVEALLGAAAFAAAMANVLGIPSWRCLTKGPVGRVARRLCGLSANALEDLLGLLVDVVLIADVCEVTNLLNEAVSLIQGPITDFVSVAEGALCQGDFSAPPKVAVAALSLPPVGGLALSLG